jgi:hypothetical protein
MKREERQRDRGTQAEEETLLPRDPEPDLRLQCLLEAETPGRPLTREPDNGRDGGNDGHAGLHEDPRRGGSPALLQPVELLLLGHHRLRSRSRRFACSR